jgi:hypothetical protein
MIGSMNYVHTNFQFSFLVFPLDAVSICGYPLTDVKFPVWVTEDRKCSGFRTDLYSYRARFSLTSIISRLMSRIVWETGCGTVCLCVGTGESTQRGWDHLFFRTARNEKGLHGIRNTQLKVTFLVCITFVLFKQNDSRVALDTSLHECRKCIASGAGSCFVWMKGHLVVPSWRTECRIRN